VYVTFDYALGADLEYLVITGSGAVDGTGNDLANRLTGNQGDNVLSGLLGDDTLLGRNGDDTLFGGAGADRLEGASGRDVLRYTSASEGGDTVVGFNGAFDLFEVSAAGFGGGLFAGIDILASARFTANTTGLASTAAGIGQFIHETDAGLLWWDADGFGGADAVVLAAFTSLSNFTGADFVVVA